MSTTLHHRYPGIRSFEASEQDLFFGRSEEIRGLYNLCRTLPLVVLFSKSGIGKSSLINAGLVPLLELEPYIPLKIRLQDTKIDPSIAVTRALAPLADPQLLSHYAGSDHPGFWEALRACRFERYGEPATPVLIFDQFEEFFLHSDRGKHDFILDLADLVSLRLPNRIRDQLLAIPPEQRTANDMLWYQAPKIKVIIAIRSDRLSLLDDFTREIPLIFNNRYQLKPLQRTQAREAIVEPALLPGTSYATPIFTYKEETLGLIMDVLTNKSQEIESFQLQLVCRHIELELSHRLKSMSGVASPVVDENIVANRDDIHAIINDYYEKSIRSLPAKYEEPARNFIETGLIVGGRRVGVTEGVEKENFGIEAELLGMLVESRLIRIENTHLGRSFEVSHDALVEPILQSYERRRKRLNEEAIKKLKDEQERTLAEEVERRTREQKLTHEQRLRKRSLAFAFIAGSLALLASGAFYVASDALDVAKKQRDDAGRQNLIARDALKKYKEAELKLLSTKVDVYMTANQPTMALKELERVRMDTLLKLTEFPPELAEKEAAAKELEKQLTKTK